MRKIYLSGSHFQEGDANWRAELVDRLNEYHEPDFENDEDVPDWPVMKNSILGFLDYVGPYPDDFRTEQIRPAIEQADFIFVWADELLPADVGRVSAELGLASVLGKRILIGTTDNLNPSFQNIWVANHIASIIDSPFIASSPKPSFIQALRFILNFIPVNEQVQLYRKAKGAGIALDKSLKRSGYVYIIKSETGECKIGRSIDVPNRMKLFAVKLPFDFEIIHHFPCLDAFEAEAFLHQLYAPQRKRGEWFLLSDNDIEDLKYIDHFSEFDFIGSDGQGVLVDHPIFNETWESFGF